MYFIVFCFFGVTYTHKTHIRFSSNMSVLHMAFLDKGFVESSTLAKMKTVDQLSDFPRLRFFIVFL